MMNKIKLLLLIEIPVMLGFASYSFTHSLFSDTATSANNTFTAMAVFATPTPVPTGEIYVDQVASVSGTFGHCCGPLSSDPAVAEPLVTGAPDSTVEPFVGNFIQISDDTVITLKFTDNKVVNGTGADVRFHNFDAAFVQTAHIEVGNSADCTTATYLSLGNHNDDADVDLDIGSVGLSEALCFRMTDLVEAEDPFPSLGFDLDAVEALHSEVVL